MRERLLTGRWLGLTLLAVVLVAACASLGLWQLGRAQDVRRSERVAADAPLVPIDSLTRPAGALPAAAVGRLVSVTGTYDPVSYLVAGRTLDGSRGSWVVSLLRTPVGAGVVVVRGWTAGTPSAAPAPAAGEVTVRGRLAPSEEPGGGTTPGTRLPSGQLPAVDPVDLLRLVRYPVYDGYVVPLNQQPPEPVRLRPLPQPAPATQVPGFYLQHIAYVALWWLFGLFVVAFWVRLLRDELAEDPSGPGARLPA